MGADIMRFREPLLTLIDPGCVACRYQQDALELSGDQPAMEPSVGAFLRRKFDEVRAQGQSVGRAGGGRMSARCRGKRSGGGAA